MLEKLIIPALIGTAVGGSIIKSRMQTVGPEVPLQIYNSTFQVETNQSDLGTILYNDTMPVSKYLRPYEIWKSPPIWRALDGSSYIDSNHEVVQWFAEHTEIKNAALYYNDINKMVVNAWHSDSDQIYNDYWLNADYYLSHKLIGDCEDYTIAIASIFEAKEIPNMIVGGFIDGNKNNRHWILEYYYDNEYYVTDTYYGYYITKNDLDYGAGGGVHPSNNV